MTAIITTGKLCSSDSSIISKFYFVLQGIFHDFFLNFAWLEGVVFINYTESAVWFVYCYLLDEEYLFYGSSDSDSHNQLKK